MKGRRSTKTQDQRDEDLKRAINRSGRSVLELLQLLVKWYGWKSLSVVVTGSGLTVTLTPDGEAE